MRQVLPAPPKPANTGGASDSGTSSAAASGAGNVVLYTALFDVANPKGELKPEMSAQVFFVTGSARDVPTVPMTALTPSDAAAGRYTVQAVVGRHLETRTVRIGVHDRFTAEVLSGLKPGDAVVTGAKADTDRPSLLGFRL